MKYNTAHQSAVETHQTQNKNKDKIQTMFTVQVLNVTAGLKINIPRNHLNLSPSGNHTEQV